MMHAPPRMVHTHPILPLGVLSLKRLRSRANKREQKNQNDSNWQENHTENDNGSDEDDDDLDDYLDHCGDISYPLRRLLEMKEHPNYVVMKERGYALSNRDISSGFTHMLCVNPIGSRRLVVEPYFNSI
eukprot:516982_1